MKPYCFQGVEEFQDEQGWYTMVNMKDVWTHRYGGKDFCRAYRICNAEAGKAAGTDRGGVAAIPGISVRISLQDPGALAQCVLKWEETGSCATKAPLPYRQK